MDVGTIAWLNRIGLILYYFSCWFAAPEILGEDIMKRIEMFFVSPRWLRWIIPLVLFGIPGLIILSAQLFPNFDFSQHPYIGIISTIIILVVILMFGLEKPIDKIQQRLYFNKNVRRQFFIVAAILFFTGTALQFIGSF